MNRDETIVLFEACERKRAEALTAGLSEDQAHEAAKACWNTWANSMLAERKTLQESGAWLAETHSQGNYVAKNDATSKWIERASTDFSELNFSPRSMSSPSHDKQIRLAGDRPNFEGYVSPGNVSFRQSQFQGPASFKDATFDGWTQFNNVNFQNGGSFENAIFYSIIEFAQCVARDVFNFDNATCHGWANF
jgi:hypothetical protein